MYTTNNDDDDDDGRGGDVYVRSLRASLPPIYFDRNVRIDELGEFKFT